MRFIREMEESIEKTLRSIGLSKSEAIVYIDLVKHPESTALEISKNTKLHRANIYDSLRRLNQRGFVAEILTNERKYFEALKPEKIKLYLKQKEQEVDKLIESLKEHSKESTNGNGSGKVTVTEGKLAGIKVAEDLLEIKKPIYILGAHPGSNKALGENFAEEFHKKRLALGIPFKILFSDKTPERIEKINKMPLTEAKHLNHGNKSGLLATIICGDCVYIICSKNLLTIMIKNQEVAEAYRSHFYSAWEHASI